MDTPQKKHGQTPPRRPASPPLLTLAALAAIGLGGCGKTDEVDPERRARAIEPVARVVLKAQQTAPGSRTGEQVYKNVCASCHASGALGAPKTGDAGAWGPRIAKGLDALTASAIQGIGQMPARGGAADLTDDEVKRAVAYLGKQSGASFVEPSVGQ